MNSLIRSDEEMQPKTPIEEGDRGTIPLIYDLGDGQEKEDIEVEVQVDSLETELGDDYIIVSIPYQSPMIVVRRSDFTNYPRFKQLSQ